MKTLITVLALVLAACGSQADMAKSKHVYRLSAGDPQLQHILLPFQFILNSISDRLDKLESLRGTSLVQGDIDLQGKVNSGIVPFPRLKRAVISGENSALVTLDNAGGAEEIVRVNVGSVVKDDFIIVVAKVGVAKGATGGETTVFLVGRDTSIEIGHDDSFAWLIFENQAALESIVRTVTWFVKVTASGVLTLTLDGTSAGSNATVSTGQGQLYAIVLHGS